MKEIEINFDYQGQLQQAEKRLEQLEDERERIEREIAGITHVIEGLKFLAEKLYDDDLPKLGPLDPPADFEDMNFAGMIREVLARNREPMTRIEIREALQALGIKGTTPKHLLISVHTVIKRMLDRKEVIPVITAGGKAYKLPTALDKYQMSPAPEPPSEYIAMNAEVLGNRIKDAHKGKK